MHLILFDCDGTLADSFGLITETMRRTFRLHGFEPPADAAIHAIIGLSLDRAIQKLRPEVDPAALPTLVEAYRTSFRAVREGIAFRERLFDGITALLAQLHARPGVRLGMVTGKTRRGVDAVVATHGLEGIFDTVRTADDCASKPDPAMVLECCRESGIAPDRTLVVGDAVFDMAMARQAGAEGLGVGWGAGSADDLIEAGASEVARDVEDLERLIGLWLSANESDTPRKLEVMP